MTPFLFQAAQYIYDHYRDETERLCIILPNKRGALYLKQHLAKVYQKTIWLPAIISAEELVTKLSGLEQADNIDLICDLYVAYTHVLKEKAESFDAFSKWGNLMLQDFNEADRYLIDTKALYQNLKEIKEIENWSLSEGSLTPTQQDYVNFMWQMGDIYEEFSKILLAKKQAYQGLMYRKSVEQYKSNAYIQKFSKLPSSRSRSSRLIISPRSGSTDRIQAIGTWSSRAGSRASSAKGTIPARADTASASCALSGVRTMIR